MKLQVPILNKSEIRLGEEEGHELIPDNYVLT